MIQEDDDKAYGMQPHHHTITPFLTPRPQPRPFKRQNPPHRLYLKEPPIFDRRIVPSDLVRHLVT